jgi:hypothetical protein
MGPASTRGPQGSAFSVHRPLPRFLKSGTPAPSWVKGRRFLPIFSFKRGTP